MSLKTGVQKTIINDETIFRKYKEKLISFIENANLNIDFNIILESSALLFVSGNFIIRSFDFIPDIIKFEFRRWAYPNKFDEQFNSKELNKRIDFYSKVIKGAINVRAESFATDEPNDILDNTILKCAVAFCDILKNPLCFNDYENAPLYVMDIIEEIKFSNEITFPIIEIISSYAVEMLEYCGSLKPLTSPLEHTSSTTQTTKQVLEKPQTEPKAKTKFQLKAKNKKSKSKKISKLTVALISVIVILFCLNIFLIYNIYSIDNDNSRLRREAYEAESKYQAMYEAKYQNISPEYLFYHHSATIVRNDGTNYYHYYKCPLNDSKYSYHIFTEEDAVSLGYERCPECRTKFSYYRGEDAYIDFEAEYQKSFHSQIE